MTVRPAIGFIEKNPVPGHTLTNIYRCHPGIKSCEDAAMNDKTLKCITMMSHEIKPIYRSALCEKYGNNIALASKTALCI